jgi:hypothetical protein
MTSHRLTQGAGWSLVAIAVLHTLVFIGHPHWSSWLAGGLREGSPDPDSLATFWALPGGFAVVMVVLGLLLARMGRRGERVPGYVGWALGIWALACVWLIGPSGFLLGLLPAGLLAAAAVLGRRRPRDRAAQA